jgi:hypothetical protein
MRQNDPKRELPVTLDQAAVEGESDIGERLNNGSSAVFYRYASISNR